MNTEPLLQARDENSPRTCSNFLVSEEIRSPRHSEWQAHLGGQIQITGEVLKFLDRRHL